MKKVDYIVVGSGLAGILFCEILKQHDKSFVVFDNESQHSSTVAGGMYNPVILKRFTKVWKAKEQLDLALPMYHALERSLNTKLDYKISVYRLFASVEEQNNWFEACDRPNLSEFLSAKIEHSTNTAIDSKYGLGKVLQTGQIDTTSLIEKYRDDLETKGQFIKETFNYSDLISNPTHVIYKNHEASKVVFAEGFGLTKNPFFNYLPLKPAKGELLTIYAPDLKIDFILKSSVFIMPLGKDLYIVGATYNWEDTTHNITVKAKEELLNKLERFMLCDYKVVDQVAGIRPTVKDRRPLVGQHHQHKNMFVLNGLGTRGVMTAPYVAKQLFSFIEKGKPLEKEINISRFS
ncbi:MAG: FAD-binding oxidoreductase [Flavobacteriaceae bacterium]|nr:FAD-binding oxidoreductase [Flavobacteriaceae bacterium]